ncbi:Protein of unknown function [Gryllus bimaculatus]|nr:Protein of unknown function [Gryllus bimaculatus]
MLDSLLVHQKRPHDNVSRKIIKSKTKLDVQVVGWFKISRYFSSYFHNKHFELVNMI